MTDNAVNRLVRAFQTRTLPEKQWNHRAHILVGLAYLLRWPLPEAQARLRRDIRAYNEATGVPNTDDSGYHETLTRLFLLGISSFILRHCVTAATEDVVRGILSSPLADMGYPLRFYTRKLLFSVRARREWVEGDLQDVGWNAALAG